MKVFRRSQWTAYFIIKLFLLTLIFVSCKREKEGNQKEIILARIGDVTISSEEFMRRAEMTIRPAYCNGNTNLHKKIVLNSLIAEKMLAIETGEIQNPVIKKQFQLYIQGRQEQAMREWLMHKEGFEKVQLEDEEIEKAYSAAGRTYRIYYFNIPGGIRSTNIDKLNLNKEGIFEQLHQKYWPGQAIPEREVSWNSQQHSLIHNALFSDTIAKGTVIGPLKVADDDHVVLKVAGWKDNRLLSENDRKQRRSQVKEKLKMEKAINIYDTFAVSIMEGKKLDFNRQTFNEMVKLVGPFYLRSPEDKRELFLNATFNQKDDYPELIRLAEGIDGILDDPFFKVEDQVWTVRDFKNEIQKHPLVFRRNLAADAKFAEHFRFAIIDMVRDRYLTDEAYERDYHNVDAVKRYTQMWHDAALAQHHRNMYLRKHVSADQDSISTIKILENFLNPYINELQEKYDGHIFVNVDEFNKLNLTRTNMIVVQRNVPFKDMVPAFPQITTDYKLDYGKKMD